MKIQKRLLFSFFGLLAITSSAGAACYVNSDSHLPREQNCTQMTCITNMQENDFFKSCGPSSKNADLMFEDRNF